MVSKSWTLGAEKIVSEVEKRTKNVFKRVTAVIWPCNYLNEDNDGVMNGVYPETRVKYTWLLLRHRDQLNFHLTLSGPRDRVLCRRSGKRGCQSRGIRTKPPEE